MTLTAGTTIAAPLSEVWDYTQNPAQHQRWDLRFTSIEYRGLTPNGLQDFIYTTRIGALAIAGWGRTVPEKNHRGSKLSFGSDDPKSLITEGSGCWIYRQAPGATHFHTRYNYAVRFGLAGRAVDRLFFRPLLQWATRWSFDRLRLWIEQSQTPELSFRLWAIKVATRLTLALVWFLEGLIPKLLYVHAAEVDLVRRSQIWLGSPELTLALLGLVEMIAGLVLFAGYRERLAMIVTSGAIAALTFLVLLYDPFAFSDPYGGLIKNLALIIGGAVVWALSPHVPNATRAKGPP
jgi:hypothetical protein